MKKLITKLGSIYQLIINFFINCAGWIHSIWILGFNNTDKPWIFYGYNHFELAKRYARKRYKAYPCDKDQLGKQQGVLPYQEVKLLVCSPLELKILQKKGLMKRDRNYTKYFKHSYYKIDKR